MSENSKKKYFSVFIVTFIIFISSIHETNFYETGDHERVEVELDSSYSSKQSIDNLNFRTDDILSGVLNEVGDKEGGRVCHPDCPSGWEEDEYDLWEVENSDVGGTLEVRISDIGADDGTDATVEICFGNLGSIWCSEVLEGNGGDVYVIDKIVLNSYIRISPNPSFFDDDVDYSIEIIDEFEDNNLLETMTIPWERSFSYNGYVCSEQCHDDNEEWSEFGNDFGDYYEISLLTNEEMLITINTETIPNRGYIHFWLIYEKGSIWHVEKVTFGDEGELEVYLQTDVPLTYTLIIASGISNDWDGMTYQIKGDLLWKNNLRSWMNNDYDGDGWDDITERDFCETEHLDYDSVPEDNDGDFICDIIDLDDDNDGWSDLDENTCRTNSTSDQSIPSDFDNDMVCDFVDPDDDDDGVLDRDDAFPLDNSEWTDSDGDGTGNNADTDDDNDGRPDWSDAFPLDDSEWTDSDGDGTGNNADTDDDNDGWSDLDENKCLTSPTSDQSIPSDFDNDMICDLVDTDSDNDGFTDEEDIFPFNFNEWADYNQDGIGDNEDPPPFITKRTLLILSLILFLAIIIYFSKQKKDKRKKLEDAMVEYPKGDLGVIRQSLITFENERKYFITEYEKSLKQDAKSMIIELGKKLDKKAESDSKKMKEIYLENIEHHKKFEKSETLDKKYEYRIEWEISIRKAERAVYDVDQKEYHHIVLDGWLRNWDWEISSTSTVLDDRNKLEKQIKKDLQITRKSKKEQEKIEKREKEKELKAKKERERKAKAERERKAAEERERMAERERIRKAEVERERKVTEERERKAAEERERKAAEERKKKAAEERERKAKAEIERKAKAERERKAKAERERKAAEERKRKAAEERKRKAEERKRKAEEERFQQTLVEKYYEFRLGIPGLTPDKYDKWKKKDDGIESKGTRENNVVGLEKTGVRPPLIENWVNGFYHMEELRRLNQIKFHEDDNRLVDILVICNLYEDLRAKNLSLEYAVSKHTRQDDMAKQEKFLTRHLLLYGEDFEKGTVYHELLQYHVGTNNGVKIGLSFTEKIEIICGGVSNKKMTERWYNICYELNKIDELVVDEKSILPILLSNQFSLGEFEILYQQIISLDQQTDETLQLLRKILEEEIDGEKIEKFERWGILEEKYHDSLLRILDGEHADIVLDKAGLLN